MSQKCVARIIDESDTVREVQLKPVTPGLDFRCEGICLTSPDEGTALDRGIMIYDALFAKLSAEREVSDECGRKP